MAWKVTHIDETDSTNRWLAEQGGDDDMVVWTDYQTAGRGCGTNRWESERGRNLLFSVRVHPTKVPAAQQFSVSMAMSMAVVGAVGALLKDCGAAADGLSVKWPNDIYWHDRKLCGILIEHRLSGRQLLQSIIGVGLNVNQGVFLSDAPNPVSLRQIVGRDVSRERLLDKLLCAFEREMAEAEAGRWDAMKQRYEEMMYRREGLHPFRDVLTGEVMTTVAIRGVDADGRLMLEWHRDPDRGITERRTYGFKEVQFMQ